MQAWVPIGGGVGVGLAEPQLVHPTLVAGSVWIVLVAVEFKVIVGG